MNRSPSLTKPQFYNTANITRLLHSALKQFTRETTRSLSTTMSLTAS